MCERKRSQIYSRHRLTADCFPVIARICKQVFRPLPHTLRCGLHSYGVPGIWYGNNSRSLYEARRVSFVVLYRHQTHAITSYRKKPFLGLRGEKSWSTGGDYRGSHTKWPGLLRQGVYPEPDCKKISDQHAAMHKRKKKKVFGSASGRGGLHFSSPSQGLSVANGSCF